MSKLYTFLTTVGFLMITLAINAQPTFYFNPSNQTPGLGEQITVDVLVDGFTDITTYQHSVNWNTSHLSYVSIGNFNSELALSMANFGTTLVGSGKLSTLWNDPLANPQTLPSGSVLFTITFDVVAPSAVSTDVQFTGDPTGIEVTQDTGGGIMDITESVIFIDTTIDIDGGGSGGGLTCNFSGFGLLVESDSADTGEQVCLDVAVCNFTDILSMQYTMQFNPALLQFDSIQNYNLQDLSSANFGTTMAGSGFVTLSWNDQLLQGVTVPNETVIYSICFTAIGAGGSIDSLLINSSLVQIEVIEESTGNELGLESIDGEVKITGDQGDLVTIIAECDSGAPGDTVYVDVTVKNFVDMLSLQSSMGWNPAIIDFYEIQQTGVLPGGVIFNTSPALVATGKLSFLWNDPLAAGVTLADNTVIFRVGYIVTGNGGQSSIVAFTDDPVVREASQKVGGNDEEVPLSSQNGCVDVDDDIDPGLFGLVLSNEIGCPGDTIEVEVSVQNFNNIVSLQYDVQWDNAHLEYVDVVDWNLTGSPLVNQNNPNTLRIVWVEPTITPQTEANGTVIYKMRFVLLGGNGSSSDIVFLPHNPPSIFVEISQEPGGVIDDYNLTGATATVDCGGNPITTSALVTNILCPGDITGAIDLTVTGGSGNYTFLWSPGGSTSQSISGLSAGEYTVTISDGVNQVVETYTIVDIAISSVSTMVSCNSLCDGGIDLIIPGYTGNFSFNWSNSLPSTEDQSGLCAGTYFVTITGANGCTKIEGPIPVTQPSELTASGVVTNETGMNMDGAIDLTVSGGTPAYDYIWSNGAMTQNISGLSQGNYTVTVTDQNGCEVIETYLVDGSMAVEADVVDVSCSGNDDGEIHLNVAGGVAPYSYEWAMSTSTSPDRINLFAGSYTVTVTDANGVMIVASIQVGQPAPLTILQADVANETGNGCNGSIDITVTGGTPSYDYQWSNGATSQDISPLCKGNYNVTITDANGCILLSSEYTVAAPPLIVANSSQTDVTCNGGDDGSVCISVLGGCGPWKFSIPAYDPNFMITSTDGEECINDLPAGNYNIVIQDSGTPTSVIIHAVTIDEPDPIIVGVNTIFNNSDETCDDPDGAIDITVSGGTSGYTYLWSNGSTLQDPTGLCHLAPFNPYTVTVTDANGCTHESDPISLNLGLFISIDDVMDVCSDCDGSISVTVTGGEQPYMYDWGGADPNSLCAGTYGVTVTDAQGNTAEVQNIMVNEPLSALLVSPNNIVYPNGNMNDGSISVNVTGGYPSYTYLWSNGATTQNIAGLAAGNYTLTVTDANGCQTFFNQDLSAAGLNLNFTIETPVCYGDSNGLIEVFVTGGSGNYSYDWFPNVENQSPLAFGLASGNYSITVTDLDNTSLSGEETIALEDPDPLVINIISTPSSGGASGSLEADVEGGTQPYSYLWNDDNTQTTKIAENLPSGEYAVRVEDANGCVEIAQGVVELGGECFSSKELLSFNGNGKNTQFIIRCSGKFDNTLQIFNRWGQLVYNTSNYDNTWSGVDNDGNDAPAGGYYFVFEYDEAGTTNRVRGSITILR